MKKIDGSVVFVTGACGGIGEKVVGECVNRGAKKIYAAGLNTEKLNALVELYGETVVPIILDVTNYAAIEQVASDCVDVDILVNNAGVECATGFTHEKALQASQFEMNVNYFGTQNTCYAFNKVLREKETAAIVNMLSIASFTIILKLGTYCASKAAAHIMTQGLREELKDTGVSVYGVYPGYVDTQMVENIDVEKATPASIVKKMCDGIESGVLDIFPDAMSAELSNTVNCKNSIFSDFMS